MWLVIRSVLHAIRMSQSDRLIRRLSGSHAINFQPFYIYFFINDLKITFKLENIWHTVVRMKCWHLSRVSVRDTKSKALRTNYRNRVLYDC